MKKRGRKRTIKVGYYFQAMTNLEVFRDNRTLVTFHAPFLFQIKEGLIENEYSISILSTDFKVRIEKQLIYKHCEYVPKLKATLIQ